MAWSSGSTVFEGIINTLSENVPDHSARMSIYADLIELFEAYDCDTLGECLGRDAAFDEVYKEIYPDAFEDDPDDYIIED